MQLAPVDTTIIGVYLLAMVAIGWLVSKRIRFFTDYFLAGGALTTPLLVCTLVSTYYELDVTFAVSETGFYHGLVAWCWLERPYYLTIVLAALLLAPRLKRHAFLTIPDLLDFHYGRGARVTGAIACFVYSLPVTAVGGMLTMLELLGWPRELGLATIVGVCAVYTMVGGLWADAISDTVQFLLMCVAIAVALPPALSWVGGFEFAERLPSEHMTATGGLSPWLLAAYAAGALTVLVEPAFYQRIFAARDAQSVRRALLIGILLWAAYDWGVTVLGLVARAAVEMHLLPADLEGREALLTVALTCLPVGLKGLFLGGVLAAAMSSIDSYALLASGNLVYDILRPLRRQPLADRTLIRLTRLGVLVVMLLAVVLSLYFERLTHAWVFLAGVLASAVLVPVLGALFAQARRVAGLAAAVAGLGAYATFQILIHRFGEFDTEQESWVWRIGEAEIWREYAILCALPASFAGFVAGQIGGRR